MHFWKNQRRESNWPPPPSPSLSMGPLSLSKVNSNNEPQPLKQIPKSISKRVWKNLSSKDTFENSKTLYEKYLNNSGLEEKLNYHQGHRSKNQNIKIKKLQHEIILLNLLFSKTVKMNVGYKFLQFINRHFLKQPGNIFKINLVWFSCMLQTKILSFKNILKQQDVANSNTMQLGKYRPTLSVLFILSILFCFKLCCLYNRTYYSIEGCVFRIFQSQVPFLFFNAYVSP